MGSRRVLVAGIGNVFLGDDGFGVEVAKKLAGRRLPEGVEVRDFGIRGMDLAYALGEGYDLVVMVDATPQGGEPGTVYVIDPAVDDAAEGVSPDAHGMDPARVIKLSHALGAVPGRTLVVGCEPGSVPGGEDYDEMLMELSAPVRAAVDEAARLVESLVEEPQSSGTRDPQEEVRSA
jgi:hydrogenase maturation protease